MTELSLDRIALDDVGANPARLARAIHDQLDECDGAIPVHAIARALDIREIREEPLTNLEGALVTTPERGDGRILLNMNSGYRRRRFTLGHELLHFLNPWHRPTAAQGFWCTRGDMKEADLRARHWHFRQEAEANTFAIELLAPRRRLRPYLSGEPDLEKVLVMADDLKISREAAARRYVATSDDRLAVVFSKDGRFLYADRQAQFPWLDLQKSRRLPSLPPALSPGRVSRWEEAAPEDWLRRDLGGDLSVQTLAQRDGYAITLLLASSEDEDDEIELDDTYDRFSRFGRRD